MKNFWSNLKPITRVVIIICSTAIVMALIFTGQLNVVLDLFK